MHNVYDVKSGLYYLAMTSERPEEPVKKHSTVMEGLGIVGGFILCALAIVIAI